MRIIRERLHLDFGSAMNETVMRDVYTTPSKHHD
jgi:hypothetical protein